MEIRVQNLRKTFQSDGGQVTALNDVTLDVPDGTVTTLLGPSGCGKTTLLRCIAGLETPDSGTIRIGDNVVWQRNGERVTAVSPDKRGIGMVFQTYAIWPHMTVFENVAYPLQSQGVPRAEIAGRVARALEFVQLGGYEKRPATALSGGQQQRVALARALVNHPKVLLLDEPLGALDLKLRQAMQLELKQLQERVGITFVYVTHDQEEALTMSDRIAVMDQGQMLQVGSPEEIYSRPRNRFVADFIGDTNLLAATVIDGSSATLSDGTTIRVTTDHAAGSEVTVAVRPEHLGLRRPDADRDLSLDAIHGRVDPVTIHGNPTAYEVIADAGEPLASVRVRQGNAPGIEHFAVGDHVRVRWAPASATVLED